MCDIRLFRSAKMDYETAAMIWKSSFYDELILNNAAYHLQQAVEKVLKGALECVGVTVPNTLSGQRDTRPKYRLSAAGGVNVNRRTSSTPHSVALPATKRRYLGSGGVLHHRFAILQGTGTKRTGRTLSDSNAAESQICGAKPCVPLSTEGIHKISKLVKMISDHGANLIITDWVDDHSEMLGEWEAQARYDMDFLVEKRKLDQAMKEIGVFLDINGIRDNLREELQNPKTKSKLLECLPHEKRECNDFCLNCYYIMFRKKL